MKLKWNLVPEGLKKINKTYLLLAALVGILLLIITIPVEEDDQKKQEKEIAGESTVTERTGSNHTYRKELERQLKEMLGNMEGVGKAEVMITLKDDGETVVEKDLTKTQERVAEEDGQGISRENSVISSQEETIYTGSGTEEGTPFVAKEINPQVEGVLVVAQGGGNSTVVKNISDAILALFPIEAHKIKVVKMN